jgi:hypothetical protein
LKRMKQRLPMTLSSLPTNYEWMKLTSTTFGSYTSLTKQASPMKSW